MNIKQNNYSKVADNERAPGLISIFILAAILFFLALQKVDAQSFEDSLFFSHWFADKHKKTKIIPVPYVGYLPETRILAGGALMFITRMSKDTTLPFSFFESDFTYTQNHQTIIESDLFFYLGSHYILKSLVGYENYPDRFWGIGNNTPVANMERYNSQRIYAKIAFLRKVTNHFYVGVKYSLMDMYDIKHLSGNYTLSQSLVRGNAGSFSNGAGVSVIWDSRDNILNTSKGTYASFFNPYFGKLTGSAYAFARYEFDVRHFVRLSSKGVFAFQTTGTFVAGNPPFPMFATLGSDMDMRGYYRGRFRDKDYMSIQAEYRQHLFWRIGVTAFAGVGDVSNSVAHLLSTIPKYTVGGGIRFKLNRKDNINLRIDYAWGTYPNRGLYVFVAEAF